MFKHYLGDESRGELAEIRYNITALLILNRRNVYLLTIGSIILVVMRFSWKYLNRVKVRENLHNEIWICVIQTGKKKIFEFSNPVFIKILDECCFGFVVCMSNIFSNRNVKTTKRDAKSDLIRKIYDFYSTNTEQFWIMKIEVYIIYMYTYRDHER